VYENDETFASDEVLGSGLNVTGYGENVECPVFVVVPTWTPSRFYKNCVFSFIKGYLKGITDLQVGNLWTQSASRSHVQQEYGRSRQKRRSSNTPNKSHPLSSLHRSLRSVGRTTMRQTHSVKCLDDSSSDFFDNENSPLL
jgi:hypothetical protein